MPSLKMSLGLRIRSKVNFVQNNSKLDKRSFLCHLLSSFDLIMPIKFTETVQNMLKMHVALNNDLDKN